MELSSLRVHYFVSSAFILTLINIFDYSHFSILESEDMSSGDFSEPCTPQTKMSPKTSLVHQQDEINRKYHELQQQISLEFQTKQREWERIRNLSIAAGNGNIMIYERTRRILIVICV